MHSSRDGVVVVAEHDNGFTVMVDDISSAVFV
jgi:hypothetical protein